MPRSFLVLWALVATLACWRLDPVARPITGDNQLYFYLAERAASGVAPHVSLVDTKNQLGVLATAASISAGRAAGIDDVASMRVASIAFAALAVVLAAELATLLVGSPMAGHVAALAMMASRGFLDHAATGSNPKVFLAAFLLAAHVAGTRSALGSRLGTVLAGLAAGAAFLCWQPALLVVAAISVEALADRDGRRLLVFLAAALVTVAGYEAYFALHGALGEQLRQEYAMTLGSVHTPRRLLASLAFVMTEARGGASPLRVAPLAAVALAVVVLLRSPRDAMSEPGAIAFAAGGAAATAFTLYDHQGVPDLFFVAPYFAVATGVLAALASERVADARAVLVGFTMLLAVQMLHDDTLRPPRAFSLGDQRRVASDVAEMAGGGGVWVYEAVHLLGLAHLDNHVSYGLFYDDVASVLDLDAWRPLRDGRLPRYIVHGARGVPGSAAWLDAAYDDVTPPAFAAQSLHVLEVR